MGAVFKAVISHLPINLSFVSNCHRKLSVGGKEGFVECKRVVSKILQIWKGPQ